MNGFKAGLSARTFKKLRKTELIGLGEETKIIPDAKKS